MTAAASKALLFAAPFVALVACTAAEVPQSRDPFVDVPGDHGPVRLAAECRRDDVQPYCSEAEVVGETRLVDEVPAVEKAAAASVTVSPSGHVRYAVTLRAPDSTRGVVLRQYSFVFEGWAVVTESDSLLVYRKELDTAVFVARISVTRAPPGEGGFSVVAELVTEDPVAPR